MVNSISPREKLRESQATTETEISETSEDDFDPIPDNLDNQADRWINEGGHLLP